MTSKDLTSAQLNHLLAPVTRTQRFLNRLVKRMDSRGFPPGDPVYAGAIKARDAVMALRMELHYSSCDSGVGREAKARRA